MVGIVMHCLMVHIFAWLHNMRIGRVLMMFFTIHRFSHSKAMLRKQHGNHYYFKPPEKSKHFNSLYITYNNSPFMKTFS
jgi:hypothetical protein